MSAAVAVAVLWLLLLLGCFWDAWEEYRVRKMFKRWNGDAEKGPAPWYLTPEGKAGIARGQRQLDAIARAKGAD